MKNNLYFISSIFIILTFLVWGGYTYISVFSNNEEEVSLTLTIVPLIIGVFGVGLYNLFTLDSKGNYRKLKKNTNETKRLYKYYGLDKKKYYHYEHRFEELCNIVDSRVKTTISNFILLVSAIPLTVSFIKDFVDNNLEGIFLKVLALIIILMTIVGLIWGIISIWKTRYIISKERDK